MRGTSPAARGRQRYVLARTRFARRGPHVHARARRPGQIYSVPIRRRRQRGMPVRPGDTIPVVVICRPT